MADSLSTALAMLRRQGPGRFGRFALSRLLGFWRTWRWLSALPPEASDESVVDVVTRRRLGEGQPVFAMQRPRELLDFVTRVRALAPRAVLEIGTAAGGTLLLLARAARPDATIVSVDMPGGAFGGGYAAWRRWLYRAFASPGQRLALLRGDSHDPRMRARVSEVFGGRPVDLLLIDGDHTYEGARRDFLDYAPLVRPGGLVAFHDICADPAQPTLEVPRLWQELRGAHASEELVEDRGQAGYGLGLLRMPDREPGAESGVASPTVPLARRRSRALIACLVGLGIAASVLFGWFVLRTDAGMEHDDAVYLTRGLYHAAQVSERGNLLLPRLVWSLGFESPKPPLFHGLLASATLVFGRENLGAVLVAGTLVPLLVLAAAIVGLGRTAARARAGMLALAVYFAMPAALGLGTRLLTETTLAATVVAGSYFAFRRARGGGLADEIGVGVCAGLSLLAKLLGPLFLGPAVAVAWIACWRSESPRRAVRFAAVACAVAVVIAGPWYLRNGEAALGFARFARQQLSCLYPGPAWMRPIDFVRGSVGWAVAFVLLALLLRRPAAGAGAELLRRMTLATAAISALVIGVQPMFDPRFWLPAAALVAVWAGVELDAVWERASPRLRPLVAAAMTLLVVGAVYSFAVKPRPPAPWAAARVIGSLSTPTTPSPRLCTLGNNADWNVEKLRLVVELSGVRPRLPVADLLADGKAVDLPARLASCEVVFALRPHEVGEASNERALNADLGLGWQELERHAQELVSDPAAARALGSRAGVVVFRRHRALDATGGAA